MRHRAKEEAIKLQIGEKYKPKSKPKQLEFGDDDCGEDRSSIAWVADIIWPFDFGAPVFLLREHTL
eukprot:8133855-Prorocentrum_lima.AAC.1